MKVFKWGFRISRARMSMKFGSDVENMKRKILTELDFRFCAFRTCTGIKINLFEIQTLSASARVLIVDKKCFAAVRFNASSLTFQRKIIFVAFQNIIKEVMIITFFSNLINIACHLVTVTVLGLGVK